MSADSTSAAIDRAYRVHRAAVLASLIRFTGDFELAEEALQDAFIAAIADWRRHGVPANTGAWLTVAARRRAIDRVRRGRANAVRAERLGELLRLGGADDGQHGFEADAADAVADDRLRLMFTCCHPALDMPARVALTLRAMGGLTTGEIAKAFLVTEPTMAKRIVRAKRKIADARIPYAIPSDDDLPTRLNGVRHVIYLIYSEGYSASGGADLIRPDLCAEAIRLGRLLCKLLPADAEVWGLLALMLLHDARREARTDADGHYVALASQDRRLWNLTAVAQATQALSRAAALESPGRFQIHAAIAALHVSAGDGAEIDWASIAELYGTLAEFDPSPAVAVNRATAVAYATTPEAGLEILSPLLADPALASYQPLAASHAELLRRRGDLPGAAGAYRQAIDLTHNDVERRELRRRLGELSDLPSVIDRRPSDSYGDEAVRR